MRVDIAHAEGGLLTPPRPPVAVPARPPRPRIDRFELAVLAGFACLSVWVLALDLWQVIAHGQVWTGTDGFYLVDQMQYLAWIKDASQHVLASNLFVLRGTPADYFQPAVVISGGLTALGMAPWLSLLLWKPVAVGAMFFAVRGFARRSLTGLWPRRAALVLGLFFGSLTVIYGSFGVLGDLYPGFLSWGYTFGLLAIAVMVLALLAYERGLSAGRLVWMPGILGGLASLLHPWQGELLIPIIIGAELTVRASRGAWPMGRLRWISGLWGKELPRSSGDPEPRRLGLPALTIALTGLPLIYYLVLGHFDSSWELAKGASKHSFSIWTVMLAIAPLAIPASLAYRGRPRTFLAAATRTWPLVALAIFIVSGTALGATPLHAFEGISVPLAVLAVQGVQRTRFRRLRHRRVLAWAAVALATVPAAVWELSSSRTLVAPSTGNANFISADEHHALQYLARDRQPGGVITRFYLGAVVPAQTGRHTLVGDCLWSQPHCSNRAKRAQRLLAGSVRARAARNWVVRTGARFVLADCQSRENLGALLGPVVESVHRFGCATVYTVE